MGRLNNWIDRDTQELETELEVMYDQAVSVDVYRTDETGSNPGVTDEVGDQVFLRTINVRLDPPAYLSSHYAFLAMTDDKDVQINDLWRWTPPHGTAVKLKVLSAVYAPSGCTVRLDYA